MRCKTFCLREGLFDVSWMCQVLVLHPRELLLASTPLSLKTLRSQFRDRCNSQTHRKDLPNPSVPLYYKIIKILVLCVVSEGISSNSHINIEGLALVIPLLG